MFFFPFRDMPQEQRGSEDLVDRLEAGLEGGGPPGQERQDLLSVRLGQRGDGRIVMPGLVDGEVGLELLLHDHAAGDLPIVDPLPTLVRGAAPAVFLVLGRLVQHLCPAKLRPIRLLRVRRIEFNPDDVLPLPQHSPQRFRRQPDRGRDLPLLEQDHGLVLLDVLFGHRDVVHVDDRMSRNGLDMVGRGRITGEGGELELHVDDRGGSIGGDQQTGEEEATSQHGWLLV